MIENNSYSLSAEFLQRYDSLPNRYVNNNVKNSPAYLPRFFSFCFALGLHLVFLWCLNAELKRAVSFQVNEVSTLLEFIEPQPKPAMWEVMPGMHIKPARQHVNTALGADGSRERFIAENTPIRKKTNLHVKIYDDTGRVNLPVDFIEKLDEAHRANRRFDFQNPDLELAGTFLKRPPAIEFDPTGFEDAWKPDQDILTELLEEAVEKTTKEIRIPVPGNPTVKLVCKVSVLALGGGCGFVPNGGYGRVIPDNEDDPDTLSPEEDKQCQAWWEKIINTNSRREWSRTKVLYEVNCKKPMAKIKAR